MLTIKFMPSNNKPTLAFCYGIVAGTGALCYLSVKHSSFARLGYLLLMSHGILGLCKNGNINLPIANLKRACEIADTAQELFLLPCITSTLWAEYQYLKEIALVNVLVPFVPLIPFIVDNKPPDKEFIKLIENVNLATLTALSLAHENFSGLTAVVVYSIAQISIKTNKKPFFDLDLESSYNCALSVFAFMSAGAIKTA